MAWRLLRYKDADVRIGSVTLDPFIYPELWPWALGLEIGDRVTLDDLPSTAPATTLDFFIEGVAHDFGPDHFKTTFQLSPADDWEFWMVGVPGYSEVGLTARAGY